MSTVDFVVQFLFFKQKTAYEMRISDWSSDVCSSDLPPWPTLKILSLTVFICNIEVLKARSSRWGVNASTWMTSASWDRSDGVRMSRPLMRRDLKAHSDLSRLTQPTIGRTEQSTVLTMGPVRHFTVTTFS